MILEGGRGEGKKAGRKKAVKERREGWKEGWKHYVYGRGISVEIPAEPGSLLRKQRR